jgi:enterochelin esterase-like enzyme
MISSALIAGLLLVPQTTTERPKQPHEFLPAPAEVGQLAAKLGGDESAVYSEGDVLTILYKSEKAGVQVMGGLSGPMKQIPRSDISILQAKLPGGWDEALMSVGFYSPEKPVIDVKKLRVFRGPKAPAPPVRAEQLRGKIFETKLASDSLGEERGVTVYLPPNAPTKNLPAFYMADGQGAKGFAEVLEPLILAGKMRPVAIVGVHSGSYKGDRTKPYDPKLDDRGRDYVHQTDAAWFDKHMAFFTKEVPAYAEKAFGISASRADRAVFGFSNGGAFTAALSVKEPGFAANTIPLSVGVPPEFPKPNAPLPRIYAAAGKLEANFLYGTTRFVEQVKAWGADATLETFLGGHDSLQWSRVVADVAPKIFPARR